MMISSAHETERFMLYIYLAELGDYYSELD